MSYLYPCPCFLDWHFLVFSMKTYRIQIPPPTIELSKKSYLQIHCYLYTAATTTKIH